MHFDEELLNDFIVESREHLDGIEPDLLIMEKEGSHVSQEVINRVFRAIHSIKGSSGFFGLNNLKSLAHAMENVLMLTREHKIQINAGIMDVLLNSMDTLRTMIDDIQNSENINCQNNINQINAIVENGNLLSSTPQSVSMITQQASPSSVPELKPPVHYEAIYDPDSEDMVTARQAGMYIYKVSIHVDKDLKDHNLSLETFLQNAKSLGQILAFPDIINDTIEPAEDKAIISIIVSTVLEEDLVPMGLNLPAEQITLLDRITKSDPTVMNTESQLETALPNQTDSDPLTSNNSSSKSVKEVSPETLRVKTVLLTKLINTVGELVLGRNQLLSKLDPHRDKIVGLANILQGVDLVTSELQELIMQTRMQPVGSIFGRFTRVVRDIARQLGKEIELQTVGNEVELDKSILELLGDPLTHIIRNCADHALETPQEREAAGKSRMGRIILRAYHESGQINISISDDGRGIDAKKVLAKALEKGIVTPELAGKLSDQEMVNLIFAPGFSTAEKISDVSGRGVGMDVVRTNIEKLGGIVQVDTQLGKGTTVLLRLPLTMAIVPALIVGEEQFRYAVPQVNLVELVCVRTSDLQKRIENVQGAEVLRLRDKLLPLIRLADVLGIKRICRDYHSGDRITDRRQNIADRRVSNQEEMIDGSERRNGLIEERRQDFLNDYNILVLKMDSHQFGIIVDTLYDSEEIVVKPLSGYLKNCSCFAGSTILGDGGVIMILDVAGLAKTAQLKFITDNKSQKSNATVKSQNSTEGVWNNDIIIFNYAEEEFFAIPQKDILRLEHIARTDIEQVGDKYFIQYRGEPLPIVFLDRHLPIKPLADDLKELYLIIPKSQYADKTVGAQVGICASKIVDAKNISIPKQKTTITGPGIVGSAIIDKKMTVFLNLYDLVQAASCEEVCA